MGPWALDQSHACRGAQSSGEASGVQELTLTTHTAPRTACTGCTGCIACTVVVPLVPARAARAVCSTCRVRRLQASEQELTMVKVAQAMDTIAMHACPSCLDADFGFGLAASTD